VRDRARRRDTPNGPRRKRAKKNEAETRPSLSRSHLIHSPSSTTAALAARPSAMVVMGSVGWCVCGARCVRLTSRNKLRNESFRFGKVSFFFSAPRPRTHARTHAQPCCTHTLTQSCPASCAPFCWRRWRSCSSQGQEVSGEATPIGQTARVPSFPRRFTPARGRATPPTPPGCDPRRMPRTRWRENRSPGPPSPRQPSRGKHASIAFPSFFFSLTRSPLSHTHSVASTASDDTVTASSKR
jgi:hypothetical protein